MFSGHLLCCLCRDAFFIRPGQSEQEHILSQRPEKVPRVSRQHTPSSSIVSVLVWSITSGGRAEPPEGAKVQQTLNCLSEDTKVCEEEKPEFLLEESERDVGPTIMSSGAVFIFII